MPGKSSVRSEEKTLKKKGILFVIGSLNTGGAENHLAQVASGLSATYLTSLCHPVSYTQRNKESC